MISSKYVFAKGYVPNLSEEVFAIKKLGTLCRGHMLLVILKKKKLLELFVKKNCKKDKQKKIKKSLKLKK